MVTRSRRLARALPLVVAAVALLPTTVATATTRSPAVTAPGAPAFYQTTSGDQQVKLVWTAPSDNGGANIQYYVVRSSTTAGSSWTTGPTVDDTVKTIKDLTNCAGYTFEVAAYNGSFTGPYSSPSGVLTPHVSGDQSLLQATAPATVPFETKARFSAGLTDTVDHSALADTLVQLRLTERSRRSGSGSDIAIKTGSDGAASRTRRLRRSTHYTWQFDGTSDHGCASTSPATVMVSQVVHATLSARHVARGRRVELYGTVGPSESNKRVRLQRRASGGWNDTGRSAKIKKQKLPNGKKVVGFVISYSPADKGKQTHRVSRAKTPYNAAGVSKPLSLKVR